MPLSQSISFDLANKALGGQLAGMLTSWRREGLGLRPIAERLQGLGIPVSHMVVQRWLRRIEDAA